MKVEKKAEKNACIVNLIFSADAGEVKGEYEKTVNAFVRNGQLPGFRKGKAPRAIVLQKFADGIKEETIRACFAEFYPKALKEAALEPQNLDGVRDVLFTPETGFSCTAVVEVKPEFKLPKYEKLAIKAGDLTVKDEDVDKRMASFRSAFAKFEDAKPDAVIGEGDFVEYDFKGMMDDKPVSEVCPEAKAVSEGTGSWTQVEEGRFVPEVLEAMKGMKAGETKKDIKVKFAKDVGPEAIRGKKAVYEITIKSFRSRTMPTDEEFVKQAKAESLDALRAQIRKHMEDQAKQEDLQNRRNQAIELLLKKADFDVPPSLANQQAQQVLAEFSRNAQYNGLTADYIKENRDKIMADAEERGERQVRLSYILRGIADAEKVEASEADVTARIAEYAAGQNAKPEDVRAQIEKAGNMDVIREDIRASKALDIVLAKAK